MWNFIVIFSKIKSKLSMINGKSQIFPTVKFFLPHRKFKNFHQFSQSAINLSQINSSLRCFYVFRRIINLFSYEKVGPRLVYFWNYNNFRSTSKVGNIAWRYWDRTMNEKKRSLALSELLKKISLFSGVKGLTTSKVNSQTKFNLLLHHECILTSVLNHAVKNYRALYP